MGTQCSPWSSKITVSGSPDRLEATDVALDVHLPETGSSRPPSEIDEGIVSYQRRFSSGRESSARERRILHGTVGDPSDLDQRPVVADS